MIAIYYWMRRTGIYRRHFAKTSAVRVVLALISFLLCTHIVAMMVFEGWSAEVAVWFTATAGTTVGFGDYSPQTLPGRMSTIFLLYVPIIPAIAFLTGRLIESVIERREQKLTGKKAWQMNNHILMVLDSNLTDDGYLEKVISELRRSRIPVGAADIVVVSQSYPAGVPPSLSEAGVRLVSGSPTDPQALENASIGRAEVVIVFSASGDHGINDSRVFDICHFITTSYEDRAFKLIAEAWSDSTRQRLKSVGVDQVLRPIRAYPEMIARAVLSPGSEEIVEALFDSEGEECVRYALPWEGTWRDLVVQILDQDLGTPVGVECVDGSIRSGLTSGEHLAIVAVYLIVAEHAKMPDMLAAEIIPDAARV